MRVCLLLFLTGLSLAAAPPAKPAPAPGGQARAWLRSLSLRQRAAQLVMAPCYGDFPNPESPAYKEFVALVRDLRIGGLIILNRVQSGQVQRADPYQSAAFLNRMQRLARIPLLAGGDFERGASMRMTSTVPYPHLMAYGAANDLDLTRALGAATAREARAMGVQWIFAPDADVNNNPDNPIINIRSFGQDPAVVSAHVRAFIEGARAAKSSPVLTTVKHFPGHGDTATDSHIGLGSVTASRERLAEVELPPFQAGIDAGADSVMTAHLAVQALEPEQIPATVSRNVLTGLLREQMGFHGIITTDAMDMQGLAKMFPPGEAAVRAIEAGADLLLIPRDPRAAVDAVVAAVKSGRLTRERIDRSVLKLLEAKVRVGLHRQKLVNLEGIGDVLNSPADAAAAAQVAERAVTLVRNEGGVLPLKEPESACWFVLAAGRFSMQGRDLMAAVQARSPQARITLLDPQLPAAEFESLAAAASACSTVVAATYVTASAYRGNVALAGGYNGFMERLLAAGKPVVFLSLGNPYLLRAYPSVAAYLATFSTAPPSESAAVKAVYGEIPVTGRLPVSIPGLATLGFGIKMEKLR
jgi:beta-N-acetylhexosaminidase